MPGAGLTILHLTPNHVLLALTILVNGTLAVHLTSSLSLGFCSSVWLPTHILHHDHIAFVHFLISFFYDMCSHSPQTPLPQEARGSMSKGTSIIKCPGIGNLFIPAGQRLSSPTSIHQVAQPGESPGTLPGSTNRSQSEHQQHKISQADQNATTKGLKILIIFGTTAYKARLGSTGKA